MPGRWSDTTERQLLLTIITLTAPALPKWDQVAEMMGEGFTAESVRQHYQKMRKATEQTLGGVTIGSKAKGKKAAGGKPLKRPRSSGTTQSRQATMELEGSVDDEEENERTPEKKIKQEIEGLSEDEV